jgi:membrane-bound ClpP family serine protease
MVREVLFIAAVIIFTFQGHADTFTNKETGQQFDGFAIKTKTNKLAVRNVTSEVIRTIAPEDYNISYNPNGRRKQIYVIDINQPLEFECLTDAFEKDIKIAENQGNLAIVIKIDTPGGRVDLMKRYCSAIADVDLTPVYAVIGGGENGGAYSAGAIIAMGCDKMLMYKNAVIGAATLIVASNEDGLKSAKSKFGEDIGEKFDSAHRAYCAGIAQKAGRNGLIAQAMIDRQIQVLAKKDKDGKYIIYDGREIENQDGYLIVNHKGTLLTMTAEQATEIGFADGQIDNFNVWTQTGPFTGNKFLISQNILTAYRKYTIAEKRYNLTKKEIHEINTKLDLAGSRFEKKDILAG